LWSDAEWRDEAKMLARIADLLRPRNAPALAAAAAKGSGVRPSTAAEMAGRTVRLYAEAILARPASPAGESGSRSDSSRSDRRSGLAVALRRLAATPTARVMSRLTPARVRKALKARLR
jgi:hypothetical protein